MSIRKPRRFLSGTAVAAVLAVLSTLPGSAVAAANAQPAGPASPVQTLRRVGTTNLRQQGANPASANRADITGNSHEFSQVPELPDKPAAPGTPTVAPPNPANRALTGANPGFSGFEGISHADQRLADNGNQFSLEPPDQGLCGAGGLVMEAVNNALAVYTDTGIVVVPPIALSNFWGLASEVRRDRNPPVFGPFISDPRCYYDPQVKRWFITELEIDVNPFTGGLGYRSALLLAVSQTEDPTGGYGLFMVDTTDDGSAGTPSHTACPCFGDQPLIGADANAFVVTTNEYSLHPFGTQQNNAQVYAASKQGLADAAAGTAGAPTLVHLDAGKLQGDPSQSLQPASTPPGGSYAPNREYLLSAVDFTGLAGGNRIAVWALANTASLTGAHPSLSLTKSVLNSEPYAGPPLARQKPGPRPLGQLVGEGLPKLDSNDDRMQQVVYSQGRLFSALNTGIAGDRVGSAWFIVTPTFSGGAVGGAIAHQGYVAVANTSVLFPAVAVNAAGEGVITFSATGPDLFPSAAYAAIDTGGVSGPVHVSGKGGRPEDGFTCYKSIVGPDGFNGGCRWGDYSAAVAEDAHTILMADEFIPDAARTVNANWSTFIGKLHL